MTVRVITHDDLDALHRKVTAELSELDAAYLACVPKLDASTIQTWQQQRAITAAWLAQGGVVLTNPLTWAGTSNAELYTQGIGLEAVLRQNWYPRFQGAGCSNITTPAAPDEPPLSTANAASPLAWVAELPPMVMVLGLVLLAHELK
jgi:hypothetical protein